MEDLSVKSIFIGILIGAAGSLLAPKIAKVTHSVYKELEPKLGLHLKNRRNALEDLLQKKMSEFTLDAGRRHPRFRPDYHPENLELSTKLLSRLIGRDEAETQDTEENIDFSKSIISVGGAMSTDTSYLAEGYEGDNFELLRTKGPDLRWELIYNEKILQDRNIIKYNERKMEQDGKTIIHKVPQWVVLDRHTDEIVPYSSDEVSHTHPLLIRKLPNKILPNNTNERIFVIEGTHGDVTLGFKKLLEKEDVFNEWLRDVKKHDYFESKFTVHVSRKGLAKPVEIRYDATEPITKFQ